MRHAPVALDSGIIEVVIAPPALYLIPVLESVRKEVKVAAQNCYVKLNGAFTGEISPSQLKDAGIPYVVLGAWSCPCFCISLFLLFTP